MIVPGMFVCSSFLISVCMFIVSKALLISSATVIVRAGEPFGCNRVAWLCLVCLLFSKEDGSSPVSLQLLRGGIWTCMWCPYLCLCWVLG